MIHNTRNMADWTSPQNHNLSRSKWLKCELWNFVSKGCEEYQVLVEWDHMSRGEARYSQKNNDKCLLDINMPNHALDFAFSEITSKEWKLTKLQFKSQGETEWHKYNMHNRMNNILPEYWVKLTKSISS
jgi:hypothetical protein